MSSADSSSPDDWHRVTDPKKRKQIQDRLAQRNRRKRLREAAKEDSHQKALVLQRSAPKLDRQADINPDNSLLPLPCMSVYEALYQNGLIMGLSCSSGTPAKSQPVSSDVPLSLHPTIQQLTTVHLCWIDRFPFPRMRNNLITLSGSFDDDEFIHDLFTIPTFKIKPGGAPWDPTAWEVQKEFYTKWGFLLY